MGLCDAPRTANNAFVSGFRKLSGFRCIGYGGPGFIAGQSLHEPENFTIRTGIQWWNGWVLEIRYNIEIGKNRFEFFLPGVAELPELIQDIMDAIPWYHPDIPVKSGDIGDDIGRYPSLNPTHVHGGMGRIKPIIQPSFLHQFIHVIFDPHHQTGCFMNSAHFLTDAAAVPGRTIDGGSDHTNSFLTDDGLHHRGLSYNRKFGFFGVSLAHVFN